MRKLLAILFTVVSLWPLGSCNSISSNPLTPTDSTALVLQSWSPYIVVHVTGEAFDAYKESISLLGGRGTMKGMRIGILDKNTSRKDHVFLLLESLGVEILAIVDNETLFDPKIEGRIDEIVRTYPDIRLLQIGNEITTLPYSRNMSIEEYMKVFMRVYHHTTKMYPHITLLTQSPAGSGSNGAVELEKMSELGLKDLSPQKVIVAINVYSDFSSGNYAGAISRVLRNFRIWITETGIANPLLHIDYVLSGYSLYRNQLRAERIYWYAMWAGEISDDKDFGLIRNPKPNFPYYTPTPLFKILSEK